MKLIKKQKRYFANQFSTNALDEYIYLRKPNIVEKLIDVKPNLKIEKLQMKNLLTKKV